MGSGKSTVGKQLAKMLDLEHIDLDWFFEETYKISINSFFNKYDENAFRNIEHQLVKKTESLTNCVISTGGGTPCFHGNMELINNCGLSVYICMKPESLFVRLKNSKRARPRISNLSDEDLMQRILNDLDQREKFYQMAKLEVGGEDIDVGELAEKVRSLKQTG